VTVVLKAVDRGNVESTMANTRAGTVEACQRTKLSTIMGGRIEVLGVKEGDKVKKGQLLMKLWNDDQQAQQRWPRRSGHGAQRVKEACTTAANAEREAERQTGAEEEGLRLRKRARTARAARPMPARRLRRGQGRRRPGRRARQP
jgi:HlyD family secretion protein